MVENDHIYRCIDTSNTVDDVYIKVMVIHNRTNLVLYGKARIRYIHGRGVPSVHSRIKDYIKEENRYMSNKNHKQRVGCIINIVYLSHTVHAV